MPDPREAGAQATQETEVDPFSGATSRSDLESEVRALEEGPDDAETVSGKSAEPNPAGKPQSGEKPHAEPAGQPTETPKEKPAEEKPTETPSEQEPGGEPGEGEEPEQLPDNPEASDALDKALERIDKLQSAVGKQATRAGNAEGELEHYKELNEQVQQFLTANPKVAERLQKALTDQGEATPQDTKKQVAEQVGSMNEDGLAELEEINELAPLVKTVRGLQKQLSETLDSLKKREDRDIQRSSERLAEEIREHKFNLINELHGAYPEMALPKDMTAETLNEAYMNGEVAQDSERGAQLIQRAKRALAVYDFYIKGPRGTGTPDKPHYASIHTAYQDLLNMSGKGNERLARERIAGRREAFKTVNQSRSKPAGVGDIASRESGPASGEREPTNRDEAQEWVNRLNARLDKDGREMTREEAEKLEGLLEKYEL